MCGCVYGGGGGGGGCILLRFLFLGVHSFLEKQKELHNHTNHKLLMKGVSLSVLKTHHRTL